MGIAVVGAGLAGLATACRIRLEHPESEVVLIDGKHRQSNTQIAGMRFRTKEPGGNRDGVGLERLLLSRIALSDSARIASFIEAILKEVRYWEHLHEVRTELEPLPHTEKTAWFGPQWGRGRGKGNSVLRHFDRYAEKLGVVRLTAQLSDIVIEDNSVRALYLQDTEGKTGIMNVEGTVIATGSIGGTIYHSTNKEIELPFQQIAHQRGLPLVGGSTHMWHPFGRCSKDGTPRLGCYATDEIASYDVYFADGRKDTITTELLRKHKAHDHFDEITARFVEHGSVVCLESPEGKTSWARVSHHYSHLGLDVDAQARVKGMRNLWAAGDAGAWYSTHHSKRFPGFALSKCLVDAASIASQVSAMPREGQNVRVEIEGLAKPDEGKLTTVLSKEKRRMLRDINTKYVFEDQLLDVPTAASEWLYELQKLKLHHPMIELSKDIAAVHALLREGESLREPIELRRARDRWRDREIQSVYNLQRRK